MKLSNLNLDSPKIRQGMNRLWMVITGMTSILVSIVVGTQDSDNWFPALLITGLVMYPTGLALYWLTHWIIKGFRTPPVPPKPPPNPPSTPPHSQSHQSKPDKTRIGRLTFLKYFLLIYFGLTIAAPLISVLIASKFIASNAPAEEIGRAILALWILTGIFQIGFMIDRTIRRLHDINRSGGWGWLLLVPLVNLIFIVVLCCVRGSSGENRYGMPYSNHKTSQTGSNPSGAAPPPPKNNKRWWLIMGDWNFIWDGRRGFLLRLMAVVAVIAIASAIYILIKPPIPPRTVFVQINATPYAAVFIKPPQSDKYTPPERPDERNTPVTLKVPAGIDIMLKYKEYEKEFPYEEWEEDGEIWYDFLEK